jgi:hypothetical protein
MVVRCEFGGEVVENVSRASASGEENNWPTRATPVGKPAREITFLLNFFDELGRRMPMGGK